MGTFETTWDSHVFTVMRMSGTAEMESPFRT